LPWPLLRANGVDAQADVRREPHVRVAERPALAAVAQEVLGESFAAIVKFLDEKMGHSYVDRLNSPSGVPVNVVCRNADGAHNDYYHVVYAVNFRLDEYSHEPIN